MAKPTGDQGIYVHVPFCFHKCKYCDFNSYPKTSDQVIEDYLRALRRQFEIFEANYDLTGQTWDTLYIGGGTPSVLNLDQLKRLMAILEAYVSLHRHAEVTMEINPHPEVEKPRMSAFLDEIVGFVNRLSIGCQSDDEEKLALLGRQHTLADSHRVFYLGREKGFGNINIDLIYGMPGQEPDAFIRGLENFLTLAPNHLSLYNLTLEPGTRLYEEYSEGKHEEVSEAEIVTMYHRAQDILPAQGYCQYELSNFCKPGFASRHNLIYWRRDQYLGFGPGAHSFWREKRFSTWTKLEDYIQGAKNGAVLAENWEITPEEALAERFFLGLRLMGGVDLKALSDAFQLDVAQRYYHVFQKLMAHELIEKNGNFIRLTQKAHMISNRVFVEFLPRLDKR